MWATLSFWLLMFDEQGVQVSFTVLSAHVIGLDLQVSYTVLTACLINIMYRWAPLFWQFLFDDLDVQISYTIHLTALVWWNIHVHTGELHRSDSCSLMDDMYKWDTLFFWQLFDIQVSYTVILNALISIYNFIKLKIKKKKVRLILF